MILHKKNTGTNNKPRWEPDIPAELDGKVKSIRYRSETDDYEVTLTPEAELELLRKEFDDKLNARVEEIATVIESGLRGKELADEIRKK